MFCLCFKSMLVDFHHFHPLDVAGIRYINSPTERKEMRKNSSVASVTSGASHTAGRYSLVWCCAAEQRERTAFRTRGRWMPRGAFHCLGALRWWGPQGVWYQHLHSWYAGFNFCSLHVTLQSSLKNFVLWQSSDRSLVLPVSPLTEHELSSSICN